MTVNGNLFVPLGGYGRNINHDPRSRAYRAARMATAPGAAGVVPRTVSWEPHIPAMDQGDLGRCVPTAGTAMLTCEPFWSTLSAPLQRLLLDPVQREQWAIQAYRDITRMDPFLGAWEPEDTGSDGLSLAKLWASRGLANGYEHVMSIEDAHAAIQRGPYPIGISWLSDMDRPRTDGTVSVSGTMRGGHEVLLYGYEFERDLWWCRNSWSSMWGRRGDFAFDTAGYLKLMAMQADGTPMTPLTLPTPIPVPPQDDFPFGEMDVWAERVRRFPLVKPAYEKVAAAAYRGWRAGHQ